MTVLEIIQRSGEFLARKGVDSPRLNSELLLSHVLKTPRLKLYLQFERVVEPANVLEMRELVKRRGEREPIQHILGSACFCGYEIKVDRNVLIPRPETELLAELGWKFLNEAAKTRTPRFLDFGTGSGCIAIALLKECATAQGWALDKSRQALDMAKRNAETVAERLQFVEGESLVEVDSTLKFDLIVSNPPYIPSGEIAGLQAEVRDFDPKLALDGGEDGLDFYRMLAAGAAVFVEAEGRLMIEFGEGQADAITKIFTQHNWIVEKVVPDYTGRLRILVAFPKRSGSG